MLLLFGIQGGDGVGVGDGVGWCVCLCGWVGWGRTMDSNLCTFGMNHIVVCTLDHVDWVRWPVLCKHIVWRHRKCWNFLKKILSYNHNKTYLTVLRKKHANYKVICCSFSVCVSNDDISIVMRHACERAWSIQSHGNETGAEERLSRIGSFPNWNFWIRIYKYFCPMVYGIPAKHLQNEAWSCQKLNPNGFFTVSRRYKIRSTFTAWGL